jgi:DNA-binding transcriptional LysR family regulator
MAGSLYEALPARIRAARTTYPHVQIRLLGMPEGEVVRLVMDGTLDMGFLYFPVPDDVLSRRVVSRRSQWVAMAPDHVLAGSASLGVRELAGHTVILPDSTAAPRLHHWYRDFLEKGGCDKLQFISANDLVAALGLCAAGEGLCIVAEHLKRARSDDLHYVPLRGAPRTELFAIWRSDSPVRQIAQFVSRW